MPTKQHKLFVFICLFTIILLGFNVHYFFIHRKVGPYFYIQKILNKPIDDIADTDIYKDLSEEYAYLNKITTNEPLIVFVGDSITKRFNISEFAKSKNILNRGIFSDTTQGLLNRINININNININKLFIMIGYNDLKFRTNDEIINNIKKIISVAKAEKIYIQSLLPVISDRNVINERIIIINKQLRKISIDGGCYYIDLHSHFVGNNNGIKTELTRDGTHPNYFGYKLWFSLIEDLL
jgi:lysophospholipase L1-like esterase